MSQKSFAELEKISRKQSETIKQQNEILDNQRRDLRIKEQQIEMQRIAFENEKYAETRHQVNQCVDFALKALPWWKRSTENVINRATEMLFAIRKETAKHVAMAKLEEQSIEAPKEAEKEAVIRDISSPQPPREEGAEMEIE